MPVHHWLWILVQFLSFQITLGPEFFCQELTDSPVNVPGFGHSPQVCCCHKGTLQNEPIVASLKRENKTGLVKTNFMTVARHFYILFIIGSKKLRIAKNCLSYKDCKISSHSRALVRYRAQKLAIRVQIPLSPIKRPKTDSALQLNSRAAPSVEAHHRHTKGVYQRLIQMTE